MNAKMPTPLQHALEEIDKLGAEDQQVVVEIVLQRLAERRRREIAENARSTVLAFKEGKAQHGTVQDLRDDVLGDK